METITFLMLREHRKIREIFKRFEKEKNPGRRRGLCNQFKWAIEKHLFVEEKAIFSFSQDISGKIVSSVFKLMKEHGEILNLINEVEEDLDENVITSTFNLKKYLQDHEDFEEKFFYPKLDQLLNKQQKAELIERIEEIIH